jgi:hypothetical protein
VFTNECDTNGECNVDVEDSFLDLRSRYLQTIQQAEITSPQQLFEIYEQYHRKAFKLAPKQGEFVLFRVPG